jgi:hypothetical protein
MGGGVETTTTSIGAIPLQDFLIQTNVTLPSSGFVQILPTGSIRVSLSSTTTYFLNAVAVFTTSTLNVFGTARARRVR